MRIGKQIILGFLITSITLVPLVTWGQGLEKIQSGDTLTIEVPGQEYLNLTTVVQERGYIEYRHLGQVELAGLTTQEASQKIGHLIKYYYPFLEESTVRLLRGSQEQREPVAQKMYGVPNESASPRIPNFFTQEDETTYRISPYDTLEISVFGEPELDKKVKVSDKGTIKYPLIGDVYVQGLTVDEVMAKLEDSLREGYFVDPQVNIFMAEYAKFSISGEVKEAGTFELEGPLTLADAIVLAGDVNENADRESVKVFRRYGQGAGAVKEYIISLAKEGKIFYLKPQDRIIVGAKERVYVLGAVMSPGMYYLSEQQLSIRDALTFLAGGANQNANLSAIELIRKEDGSNKTHTIDIEKQGDLFFLKAQDRVIVKIYDNISVFGQVQSPGKYPYKKGLTAVDAIALAGGFTSVAAKNAVKVIRKGTAGKGSVKVPVGKILTSGDTSQDAELNEGDTVVVPESWF